MKLPQLSIQATLLTALSVLLLVIALESFLAWFAFSRIGLAQQALLSDSLPALRYIDKAVDDSRELIAISNRLPALDKEDDFLLASREIDRIALVMEEDLPVISQFRDQAQAEKLRSDLKRILANVRQLITTKLSLFSRRQQLESELKNLEKAIQSLLVTIKLVSINIDDQQEGANNTAIALSALRSDAQQLAILSNGIQFLSSSTQIYKNRNEYRLLIQKMIRGLLDFSEDNRKTLAASLTALNQFFSKQDNIFSLAIVNVEDYERIQILRDNNRQLSQNIDDDYRQTAQQANADVDEKARTILEITQRLNAVLFISIFISILLVISFALWFVKPRIINRLQSLNGNTLQIAQGDYTIDIDTQGSDEISTMAQSLAYFRDQLVEKALVQKRLADREQALLTILNNTVEGLFTVDLDGIIRTFNPACAELYGGDAESMVGSSVNTLLPDATSIFSAHRKRAMSIEGDGYVVCREQEVQAMNARGQTLTCSLSVSLLNMSGVQVYSCFLRDISDEKAAKERIETLIDQLTRSNADLESFAYSCSHDLQEPVRTVLSFAELLDNKYGATLNEDGKKYLHYIVNGAKSAKQLIKDMLNYSRLDRASDDKEWVTLAALCEQVSDATVIAKAEYEGKLEWLEGEASLYAVPSQIVQLLTNLVINGWKYNQSDRPEVKIAMQEQEDSWLISVSDNGIGIDPRYKDQVFEVFKRLVNRRDYEGSGIGLAVCQKIAEKHGGRIWLESELGQGSCFFFTLPKPQGSSYT